MSRADASFTSAAFGLARCLERKGDEPGAADAYRRVPSTSSRYAQAQMALARLLLRSAGLAGPPLANLTGASDAVEAIAGQLEGLEMHHLRADLLRSAARFVETGGTGDVRILGRPLKPKTLRRAAEEELRACARMAGTADERLRWIDQANQVRPVTWW